MYAAYAEDPFLSVCLIDVIQLAGERLVDVSEVGRVSESHGMDSRFGLRREYYMNRTDTHAD